MYRHAWQVLDGFKVTERRDHQYVSDCYCAYSRDNSVWDRHGCCKVDCITACGCCPCATVVHCCCLPCACAKRAKRLPEEIMHTTVKYNLVVTPSGSWEEYWGSRTISATAIANPRTVLHRHSTPRMAALAGSDKARVWCAYGARARALPPRYCSTTRYTEGRQVRPRLAVTLCRERKCACSVRPC